MLALLPLALGLVPELAKWIAGDKAGTVAAQAADIVRTVTGTDDPATAEAILADPAKVTELRIRLAEIAAQREAAADQARLEMFRTAAADTANARALAASTPLIARTQVVLAASTTLAFFVVLFMVFAGFVPESITRFGDIMLGTLGTIFVMERQFFFGNSTSGHAANNATAAIASRAAAAPSPVSVQSAGTVNAAPQPSPAGTTADDLNARELTRARS
jgi:hypothetical protein